jgi:hypothetical protein
MMVFGSEKEKRIFLQEGKQKSHKFHFKETKMT